MTKPNQFTLTERGITYGLHRFKDGVQSICQQHSSGEWVTLCPPTDAQVKHFEAKGEKSCLTTPS